MYGMYRNDYTTAEVSELLEQLEETKNDKFDGRFIPEDIMAAIIIEEYFNRYRIPLFAKGIGDIESLPKNGHFNAFIGSRLENSEDWAASDYTTYGEFYADFRKHCQRWMEIEEEPKKTE